MNKAQCSITDDWTYKDMRVVFLENAFLRVGILVDRGSDIFEFRYKPLDVDPLLRLPKGILNPAQDFSQMRDTKIRSKIIITEDGRRCCPIARHSHIAELLWVSTEKYH
jgi:hypothetical protein